MPFYSRQSHLTPQEWSFYGVTVGTVVDTNDPQQMGRVRAVCLGLNDPQDSPITDIPWASYASPFGGTVQVGTRGANNSQVTGPIAYGMWGIPKIGSQVLIMCLDGNPQTRVWVGCLHTQLATHTMPHGRFSFKDDNNLPDEEKPVGPISTFETTIEPLHTNLRTAFGTARSGDENFEFESRGADFQVSGVGLGQLPSTLSAVEDDQDDPTGSAGSLTESRQGYQTSRIAPDQYTDLTPRNLDNTVTSLVSPGFHALSMDDRQENCRVRIRTTGGHQIIFDDTNERIYLATSTGENWIEMDEKGNIDIYTSGKISAHAEHDINFTTDRSFRVYAKAGIHLKSDREIRATASNNIALKSDQDVRVTSKKDISLKTNQSFHVLANETFIQSTGDINVTAGGDILHTAQGSQHVKGNNLFLTASSTGHFKASSNLNFEATTVHLKGVIRGDEPSGTPADATEANTSTSANPSDAPSAFFTNRIPDHEPWARVDTKTDESTDPALSYASANVGKQRRITGTDGTSSVSLDISRGSNWRR